MDLESWLGEHSISVKREGPWQRDGYHWVLEECPWNGHADNAAYIVRFANGAIAAGCHHDSCQAYGWRDVREHYEPGAYERRKNADEAEEHDDSEEAEGKKATQAQILIRYAEGADLFHTPEGEAYGTILVARHSETWALKSRRFTQWLLRQFYEETGKAPSAQALADARATIGARASFDGTERPVFTRIAGHERAVYVDLCNPEWEAVQVTASGWFIVESANLPVKFVRKDNAAALPRPVSGGSVEDLRDLLNVRSEEDFRLLVAWLVGVFNPDGPYPVLALQGEQGSAKSTTVRVLRSVVDPAVEPLRAPPRGERDLAIAASGNWTPALDNLSGIRPWLSDALCRLATGGGFATRELYSDDREVLFSQKRPVILNGIDSLAVAGDLRDRSIVVDLPPIPPAKKRTEREFYRELEEARPKVLGALLDAASAALRNRDTTTLEELPRMADFAVWVAAAEEALPWERSAFMSAYSAAC
ncbi:MAG: ATP-binding protein [Actinomycetota bacterium]|nr:ATP-binding protein [Actinomycetota bacterium]